MCFCKICIAIMSPPHQIVMLLYAMYVLSCLALYWVYSFVYCWFLSCTDPNYPQCHCMTIKKKKILYFVSVVIKTLDGFFRWKITNSLKPPYLGPRPTAFWFWSQTILRTASFARKNKICMFELLYLLSLAVRNGLFEFLEYLPPHFPHSARSSPPAVKVIALI